MQTFEAVPRLVDQAVRSFRTAESDQKRVQPAFQPAAPAANPRLSQPGSCMPLEAIFSMQLAEKAAAVARKAGPCVRQKLVDNLATVRAVDMKTRAVQ